jgi:TolB-like protein
MRRLLAGDHHVPTRAPFQRTQAPIPPPLTSEPPPVASSQPDASNPPPPMPPMPHVPEKGGFLHGIKFILEVFWWALTAAWMLFNRLPKWGRVVVSVWLVLLLFSVPRCSTGSGARNNERDTAGARPAPPSRPPPDGQKFRPGGDPKKMRAFVERITQTARDGKITGDPDEIARLAGELTRGFSEGFNEVAATGKSLVVVPFGPPTADDPGDRFAHAVFISLYGRIALERRTDVGVAAHPKSEVNDEALIARGRRLNSAFVLAANPTSQPPYLLQVRLLKVANGTVAWTDTYPVDDNDATNVAEQIHEKIFEHIPKLEPKEKKEKGGN